MLPEPSRKLPPPQSPIPVRISATASVISRMPMKPSGPLTQTALSSNPDTKNKHFITHPFKNCPIRNIRAVFFIYSVTNPPILRLYIIRHSLKHATMYSRSLSVPDYQQNLLSAEHIHFETLIISMTIFRYIRGNSCIGG